MQVHGFTLSPFVQGYLEAMFFTEEEPGVTSEEHDPETMSALPCDLTIYDISPDSLAAIVKDCEEFQAKASELLARAYDARLDERGEEAGPGTYTEEQAGRDFWFTRNGHGVGFWDRDELGRELGEALSDLCRYDEVWACVGDDGQIHVQ